MHYLLPLLVLVCGCSLTISPGFSYRVDIDPLFSSEQEAAIVSALHQWEVATDNKVHFATPTLGQCVELGISIGNTPADNQVCYHSVSAEWISAEWIAANDYLYINGAVAFTELWPGSNHADVYLPATGLSALDFRRVATHETGHSQGMHHTQSGTLMCWSLTCLPPSGDITCDDFAQWAYIRGISDINQQCPNGGHFTLTGKL